MNHQMTRFLPSIICPQTSSFLSFIRPLLEIEDLTTYADDNYMGEENENLELAIQNVSRKTEAVIKWMSSSGLRINETKTEICIFHRSHSSILNVTLNNTRIQSTNTINILGTLFDSNMKWNQQYLKTIKEANTNLLLSNSRSLIAFQTNLVF